MIPFVLPDWMLNPVDTGTPIGLRNPSRDTRTVYIYALIDPLTMEPRYIGKSIRPNERLTNHMNEVSRCHRSRWLQSLKRQGLRPHLVIMEEIRGGWPWQESERYWIAYGRRHGWRLTNNTSGGDGVPDLPEETRARMRETWLGRKHKPETIEKIKAYRATFRHTPETRARMSASQRGRVITWGDRISDATYKLTASEAETVRLRLLAGERVCDLATELGLHRTTVTKIKQGRYRGRPD